MRQSSCVYLVTSIGLLMANTVIAGEQTEPSGFIEDSHLNILLRNYYRHQTGDLGSQRDWVQGAMMNFTSGYTAGTIGIGFDAFAYGAVKLDGGSGRIGSPIVPFDSDGEPAHEYSRAGGSLKLKLSNTVLQVGALKPQVPVFAIGNYYLLDQTANGWMISSDDIDKLSLTAGRFTSGTGFISTAHDGELGLAYAGVNTRSVTYAGGRYAYNDQFSVSAYGSEYKDVMNQYYLNSNLILPLSTDKALTFDFNLYRSLDSGAGKAGRINLTTASLSSALSAGAHTFTIGFQINDGDQPQDYAAIGGTSPGVAAGKYSQGIYLANAAEISDFNAPNEKTVSLRYDLNGSAYGMDGWSMSVKQVFGRGIDGSKTSTKSAYFGLYGKDETERETDAYLTYAVQSGSLRGLKTSLIQSWHSGDPSTGGDLMQTRLFFDYPLDVF